MNYSGIVITTTSAETHRVADGLAALPGVEVHVRHEPSGRLVIVMESPDDEAFEAAFRNLRTQPGVIAVDLAYHYVDSESGDVAAEASPTPTVFAAKECAT